MQQHPSVVEPDGPPPLPARQEAVTADAGGSNSPRSRLWRLCLQGLADATSVPVRVCHFPPGMSKWNKIEHRLFSFIASNWRGHPLSSHQAIVELIARTTTRSGLIVRAALDRTRYRRQVKVSDAQLAGVRLTPHEFHGEWNHTIAPRPRR